MAKKPATSAPTTGALIRKPNDPEGQLIDAAEFKLISNPAVLNAIAVNLAGEQISENDLDRIRVPSGGGRTWEIPTISGDVESATEIEGIILHSGPRRAFWSNPNPTGEPPDCASADGLIGIGDPGGSCLTCPMNEFGSAIKQDGSQGAGKRCREQRALMFLRRDDRLPMVVVAPPASLKGVKQYFLRLPCPMYQAVTRLTLVADKNRDGTAYSRISFSYVGAIPTEQVAGLKRLADTLKKVLTAATPQQADFNGGDFNDSAPGSDDPANYSDPE